MIKRFLLFVCLVFVFTSCEDAIGTGNNKNPQYRVVEIDGCEYILMTESSGAYQGFGYMSHKGDCKNPIHCHND